MEPEFPWAFHKEKRDDTAVEWRSSDFCQSNELLPHLLILVSVRWPLWSNMQKMHFTFKKKTKSKVDTGPVLWPSAYACALPLNFQSALTETGASRSEVAHIRSNFLRTLVIRIDLNSYILAVQLDFSITVKGWLFKDKHGYNQI